MMRNEILLPLKDIRQLERVCRNNLMKSKSMDLEGLDDHEIFNRYFHLGIDSKKELISQLKKIYFCRMCLIHPRTKNIKLSFIQNFWETIVNKAN